MADTPAVRVVGVTHAFGANEVLRGVSMDARAGEVVALMGANGAGKSTLIKVLSGVYPLQGGGIQLGGRPFRPDSPLDARRHGLETVHQRIDEGVVPGLTVAENLVFDQIAQGELPRVRSIRQLLPLARAAAEGLGLRWSDTVLRQDVFELGIADQQLLILARTLSRKPHVLVLDEPTSALSKAETDRLFDVVHHLRSQQVAIIYVSHRLSEIDRLADRLVVLRDGAIRSTQRVPFEWRAAVHDMLGEKVAREGDKLVERHGTQTALELRGVQLFAESKPFDLDLVAGEVTGVIGLLGAGKSELARGIAGAERFRAGRQRLAGKDYAARSPAAAIASGVYLVSEDRAADALLPRWSIARTVSLPFLRGVSSAGLLKEHRERSDARELIDRLGVVARSEEQTVDALSGGNQQKVVVGRWLRAEPKVMVLDEPFRGVDIGARHEISRRTREVAAEGAAVLVLSADIDEILEVADRLLVLVDGEIRLDEYRSNVSRDEIVTQMSEVV